MHEFRIVPNALAYIEAVGIREHDVQQDQIRPDPAAKFQSSLSGLRTHQAKAFLLQVVLEKRKEIRVVFDEHDFFHDFFRLQRALLQNG
jgi:hypothetical protein